MQPIDIQIEDDFKFQIVAFLADREDFLKDLEQIRNDLGLKKLVPYEQVLKYLEAKKDEAQKDSQKTESLDQIREDGTATPIITSSKIAGIIRWLEKKYKKNSSFDMVLAFAILAGVVKEAELKETAHLQYLDARVLENFTLDGHFQVSIVVTRDTRVEEVERIFNTDVQQIFKEMWDKPDTIPNVRRNRAWYWRKKTMSWKQLYKSVIRDKEAQLEYESVRTAVRDYQTELQKVLYSDKPPGALKDS